MSLIFGKYEKIRRIAQGGMGEVFLARQTGVMDRLAILKSLRADLAKERDFVEQFLDEARVAATLNHPNIVSIYDVGEWKNTFYIAMEYVPGEDLSKLWYAAAKAGVGLPFQVSVRICYEAALALDHAHRAKDVRGNPLNIVHRDVSPQNIMVRGDGVVKLVDFGIAKAANKASRTQAGMVKGKLQYMSPEQVRGEALDGRSDQFSLGVVLWEMCTGRRLFKADSEVNTLQKILQAPIPKLSQHVPGFPPELEGAILRMLERDADRRFKSLFDVATELKGYLDRSAIASGEVSVAAFVQQILGDDLDDKVRDLTPMEPTEAGVSQQKSDVRGSTSQRPSKVPVPDQATVIVRDEVEAAREPTITRPMAAHQADTPLDLPNPITAQLKLGDVSDLPGPGFSLGELPQSATGQWSLQGMAPAAEQTGATTRTPTTRTVDGSIATTAPERRTARVPTGVWMLGGVAGALVVVGVGLAVLAPDLLSSVVAPPAPEGVNVKRALAASQNDDPVAARALLKSLAPQLQGPNVNADALAGAALLHLATARVAHDTAALSTIVTSLGGKAEPPPDPEPDRAAAYKLATQAVAQGSSSPSALLALAAYQGERGAVAELEADAARAQAAADKVADKNSVAYVGAELEPLRALTAGRAALTGTDVAKLRSAAKQLTEKQVAGKPDLRLRSLALVLRAKAASLAADEERAQDVAALTEAASALKETAAPGDTRAALLAEVARLIGAKPKVQKPPPPVAAVDAGPAPVAAAAADAGPAEPPETYESAIEKARAAHKRNDPRSARRFATLALQLKPKDVAANIMLGFALIDTGPAFVGKAANAFSEALAKQPENCDAQIGLAESYKFMGDIPAATTAYRRYLEICPTGKDVEAAKGFLAQYE
ncbi:MAG: serine/threonine protein kinase [Deltaproteobacteria bacterium]|nr:serine/threonine protein kinase [Deltaproteobacteria bacterium]